LARPRTWQHADTRGGTAYAAGADPGGNAHAGRAGPHRGSTGYVSIADRRHRCADDRLSSGDQATLRCGADLAIAQPSGRGQSEHECELACDGFHGCAFSVMGQESQQKLGGLSG